MFRLIHLIIRIHVLVLCTNGRAICAGVGQCQPEKGLLSGEPILPTTCRPAVTQEVDISGRGLIGLAGYPEYPEAEKLWASYPTEKVAQRLREAMAEAKTLAGLASDQENMVSPKPEFQPKPLFCRWGWVSKKV